MYFIKFSLQVTYEAHKEYLAKMYEEYQRQEEENIKKGKKGLVSTICGLSAQTSNIKGVIEIGEIDDHSQTPDSEADYESADSRNLLTEGKGSEGDFGGSKNTLDGVRVAVHDLLVDIKAEKVEATEVKMDDTELSSETVGVSENRPMVEVDSLLDNVYCAVVRKLDNNVSSMLMPKGSMNDQNAAPLITLDDEKDDIPDSNNFLFGKVTGSIEDNLLPDLNLAEPLVLPSSELPDHTGSKDEIGLLAHMTGSSLPNILVKEEFELMNSETEGFSKIPQTSDGSTEFEGELLADKTNGAVETRSNASETARSDDGKDKEMKKIQTTATTQVSLVLYLSHTQNI